MKKGLGKELYMNPTDKAKTINGLMIHLRDDCGININGSKEKLQLTQYGYYHGYKGYRFIKKRQNTIPYTNFSEIIAVINYDNVLKKLVYPALMFVEMAVKNFTLEQIVPGMKDTSIDNIYKTKMNDELSNSKLRLKRLRLRDSVHSMLSNSYKHENSMVSHFYNRGEEVPIWGIFEIMMLGDFAEFLQCLNKGEREKISKTLGMKVSYDTNYQLVANALFTVKSLRNTTAHNNIAFDARFSDRSPNKNLVKWVENETGITNVKFDYFSDYIALIICLLKHVQYPKKMLIKFLKEYEECINDLYQELPLPIYNKIVATGIKGKLQKLNAYIKN